MPPSPHSLDFNLVCRTCLAYKDTYANLYENNIARMINDCSFIKVSVDDGFPKNICICCQELVHLTYNFKEQCRKSETYLNQLKNENTKLRLTVPNKKDEIIEAEKSYHDLNVDKIISVNVSHKQENLVCFHCNKKFSSAIALKRHIKHNKKSNSCGITGSLDKDFLEEDQLENKAASKAPVEENLTAFLEGEAPPPLPHQCSECTQSFNAECDLKLHMSTHIKSGEFICLKCNKKFATRQMLKRHVKTHMLHKPHICKQCGKEFAESHALTKHVRRHTGLPREKKHLCTVCGQGFSEPFYLNVHMRKHTGERPLMCSSCGKSFADPRSLKAHNMTHTGERPYKCHLCSKSFTQSVNLTKHVRVHTGEKPYVCTKCGKCFTQSSTLDKHSRTHTGERPYSCDQCPKRFAEKSTLIHHQRIHTGEKPYVCAVCGKSYASNSELRLHDRKHSGVKKNVCNICGKDFATPSNLTAHLRKHNGEKPFVCCYCARPFSDKGSLRKHMKSHSNKTFTVPPADHTLCDNETSQIITNSEQQISNISDRAEEEIYYDAN